MRCGLHVCVLVVLVFPIANTILLVVVVFFVAALAVAAAAFAGIPKTRVLAPGVWGFV